MWMLQPSTSPTLSLFDLHDDFWMSPPKMNSLATDKIVQPRSYTYRLDMPGYDMSDIDIEVDSDRKVLIVKGRSHKHHEESPQSGSYSYSLRSRGHVQKSISLDSDTIDDPKQIQAHLNNGVLSVTFPRVQAVPTPLPKNKNVKNIPITKGPHTVSSRALFFD